MITVNQVRAFRDQHWELAYTKGDSNEFEFYISFHAEYMVKACGDVIYKGFDLIKAVNKYNDL